ncbi:MAG: hypothetical protein PHT69_11350, partial [Bacteroidales bacterium]|nr:hypothetical protein [Bacteroidales bacterium]
KGVLGEPDKKRVQRHLADCVMCSDEVERLEAMSNPDNIVHIEEEINHKIDEKLIEKKIRWIPFFKVAASIFLIAGLTSIILWQLDNTSSKMVSEKITQADRPVKNDIALLESETRDIDGHLLTDDARRSANSDELENVAEIPVEEEQDDAPGYFQTEATTSSNQVAQDQQRTITASGAAVTEETALGGNSGRVSEDVVSDNVYLPVSARSETSEIVMNEATVTKTERGRSNRNATQSPVFAQEASKDSESEISTIALERTDADSSSNHEFEIAVSQYSEGQYQTALRKLNRLSDSQYVVFYRGMCHYYLNNFTDATSNLSLLINDNTFSLFEDAQWFYALSLFKNRKFTESKTVLLIITEGKGKYADRATELLNSIP